MSNKKNPKKDTDDVWKKRWVNPEELYRLHKISISTQGKLRMKGLIPFSKISGFVRYDVNEIDEWFEFHKVVDMKSLKCMLRI
jgi:predicted flap endonuclease-1-like 5' DNA nuclease